MTTIRVGHIDLSFHNASALEVEAVLKKHGLSILRSAAPHEEMFNRLGRGEIDMLVSAWLPSSHGTYLKPIETCVRRLATLYQPYCIWGVPEYVPLEHVANIADLLRPAATERMERLIQGINEGAGISRFSQKIITHYGLAAAGYRFETGTEDQCFGRFEKAIAERRWVVVPLWHPQYLHNRYHIRPLGDPDGLLGSVDQATLLVRRDAQAIIGGEALAELQYLTLGNDMVSALDDKLHTDAAMTTHQ